MQPYDYDNLAPHQEACNILTISFILGVQHCYGVSAFIVGVFWYIGNIILAHKIYPRYMQV